MISSLKKLVESKKTQKVEKIEIKPVKLEKLKKPAGVESKLKFELVRDLKSTLKLENNGLIPISKKESQVIKAWRTKRLDYAKKRKSLGIRLQEKN